MVAKRSCKTRNLVCNQLRSKCRSNPAINLITLECLGIPKPLGIVDLSTSTNLSIIELSSDNGLPNFPNLDKQKEENAAIVAWIVVQKDTTDIKKSHKATRRF
jgi:hypothetical protein